VRKKAELLVIKFIVMLVFTILNLAFVNISANADECGYFEKIDFDKFLNESIYEYRNDLETGRCDMLISKYIRIGTNAKCLIEYMLKTGFRDECSWNKLVGFDLSVCDKNDIWTQKDDYDVNLWINTKPRSLFGGIMNWIRMEVKNGVVFKIKCNRYLNM
jgi:hypothetical protein